MKKIYIVVKYSIVDSSEYYYSDKLIGKKGIELRDEWAYTLEKAIQFESRELAESTIMKLPDTQGYIFGIKLMYISSKSA